LLSVKNYYANLAQIVVAAGVIAMHVGIDQKADFTVVQRPDRRHNAVGKRGILIIDHHHTIFTHRQSDIAAAPFQIVDTAGNMMRNDFHVAEILLGTGDHREQTGNTKD